MEHIITDEQIKKYKKDNADLWLKNNCQFVTTIGNQIIPMRPDIGCYITVNNLDIGEFVFPDEYKIISEHYFKIINKLNDVYYKHIKTYPEQVKEKVKEDKQPLFEIKKEVKLTDVETLGNTFIDFQNETPAEQWQRIQKILKENNLIVVEK